LFSTHTSSGGESGGESGEDDPTFLTRLLSQALGVRVQDDVQLSSTSLTAITTEQSAALAEMTKEDQ